VAEGVDHAELDHPIGQQPQAPLVATVGRFGAGQPDQLCLLLAVELAVVLAVGRFAFDAAGQAALREALPNSCNCAFGHFQRFSRASIRPSRAVGTFINFEQDANARLLCGRALASAQTFEKVGPLVVGELDAIQFLLGMTSDGDRSTLAC